MVFNEEYQYDSNGNKIYADENGKITKYSYDGLNRISSVTENGNDITQYEYDGYNNISKEYTFNNTGIRTKKYFYDKNNRLILSETEDNYITYDYDNAGNLTRKTDNGRTEYYTYDGYNRLNSFYDGYYEAQYNYNLSGLRKSKTVNGKITRFVYSGADIIGEITNDNYYVYYRGTELLGSKSYSGDVNFYRIDGHGSVTAVLSPIGEELKTYNYDAFGAKKAFVIPPMGENTILFQWKAETDGIHNPFGYCGEYTDSETGLIYLRNRYYSPSTGRFITEDPIKYGLNWYAYCENNPVRHIDPTGYITDEEIELYNKGQLSKEVYDILVDLGNRWTNAETDEARAEIHALAEEFRNNNYKFQDLSIEATNQLLQNGKEVERLLDLYYFRAFGVAEMVYKGNKWYNLVDNYGEWDYKRNPASWMPKEERYFMMNGRLISFADFGNVNYGYTGTVLGLSSKTLYKGAGYVQCGILNDNPSQYYGDSEVDFENVKTGIGWANTMGYEGSLSLPLNLVFSVMKG